MIKRCSVLALALVILASSYVLAGPAQDILGNLADSAQSERVISGITAIGIGSVVGIGGYFLLNDVGLGAYAAIAGGLMALPGLITLVSLSPAEIACSQSCDSETDSALALEEMAASAKLERYISGVVNIAAGTVSLLFPYSYITPNDYVYSAIINFGMGVIDFLFPSKEERAYESYRLLAGKTG